MIEPDRVALAEPTVGENGVGGVFIAWSSVTALAASRVRYEKKKTKETDTKTVESDLILTWNHTSRFPAHKHASEQFV